MTLARSDILSYGLGLFVAGWISSSAYYQIPHLWRDRNKLEDCVRVAVPTAKKAIAAAHADLPPPSTASLQPCGREPFSH